MGLDELGLAGRRDAMLRVAFDEPPLVRRSRIGGERARSFLFVDGGERAGDREVRFFAAHRQDEVTTVDGVTRRTLDVTDLLAVLERETKRADVRSLRCLEAIDERGLFAEAHGARQTEHAR